MNSVFISRKWGVLTYPAEMTTFSKPQPQMIQIIFHKPGFPWSYTFAMLLVFSLWNNIDHWLRTAWTADTAGAGQIFPLTPSDWGLLFLRHARLLQTPSSLMCPFLTRFSHIGVRRPLLTCTLRNLGSDAQGQEDKYLKPFSSNDNFKRTRVH